MDAKDPVIVRLGPPGREFVSHRCGKGLARMLEHLLVSIPAPRELFAIVVVAQFGEEPDR